MLADDLLSTIGNRYCLLKPDSTVLWEVLSS